MTSTISTELILYRKTVLQVLISEATVHNDQAKLSLLKAQWVHRYGFETLHECDEGIENVYMSNQMVDFAEEEKNFQLGSPIAPEITQDRNLNIAIQEQIDPSAISEKKHDDREEVDEASTFDSEKVDNLQVRDQSIDIPPPPTPLLNHLRRWLPVIEERAS